MSWSIGPADPFIRLSHSLVDSESFAIASNGARSLLILLWRRYNGRNNGSLSCSVREAATWLHCGKSQAGVYFTELQQLELIEAVNKGNFTVKIGDGRRAATTWRLKFLEDQGKGKTGYLEVVK